MVVSLIGSTALAAIELTLTLAFVVPSSDGWGVPGSLVLAAFGTREPGGPDLPPAGTCPEGVDADFDNDDDVDLIDFQWFQAGFN